MIRGRIDGSVEFNFGELGITNPHPSPFPLKGRGEQMALPLSGAFTGGREVSGRALVVSDVRGRARWQRAILRCAHRFFFTSPRIAGRG